MPKFSIKSMQRLSTCDNDLQALFYEVIKEFDCTILCGYRNEADQNKAFKEGKSKLKFPNSKHNCSPSRAVDVAPYPIDWLNIRAFERLNTVVMRKAHEMGINIEWGGNWKKFKDYPHYQLKD
jgi:peptidoglycan L-alanyl-D-glutamate endopeptidase CwlK